jgi:hypothetical protein
VAERLEEQLARGLNLNSDQKDRLSGVLADLDLPLERIELAKASKDSADYTDSGPSPFLCKNCRHFDDGSCDIVDGDIDPAGSCRWWHRTEADHGDD